MPTLRTIRAFERPRAAAARFLLLVVGASSFGASCDGASPWGARTAAVDDAASWRPLLEMPGGRRVHLTRPTADPGLVPAAEYLVAKVAAHRLAEARASMAAAGFREIAYLPDDGLLVERPTSLAPLASPAGVAAWIRYEAQDRLSRQLTPEGLASWKPEPLVPVLVHVMPGRGTENVLAALARAGGSVEGTGSAGAFGRISALLPADGVAAGAGTLAGLSEVFFVERVRRLVLLNDRSVGVLQSGVQGSAAGATPIWQQGIRGEGQILGLLDTGADADNCWFGDGTLPPANTWSAGGGYATTVDMSRRKIIGYDFLNSCDQYPTRAGCDMPSVATAWDSHGHGSHVGGNIAGDHDTPEAHSMNDGIAPAAKLVIQDGGYMVDTCAELPGLGCPVIDTYPLFEQAFRQGVRVHNNSYGDNEEVPPPQQSNYTARTVDIDRFIWDHKDFLIVHAAGNSGSMNRDFSVGSPSTNKNGLAIGSTRRSPTATTDEHMSTFSSRGWTSDGRIKPDLMAPGNNVAAGNDRTVASATPNCGTNSGGGTSYASPTAVGAAGLVRQYFTDGFYPSGARNAASSLTPTAALIKAALINSSVPMTGMDNGTGTITPIPSNEQGWGRIRLDQTLVFTGGDRKLFVDDHRTGFDAGATAAVTHTITGVAASHALKVTLVWSDYPSTPDSPPATPSLSDPNTWTASRLINDLDLTVTGPSGTFLGNAFTDGQSTTGGSADRRNNVEQVLIRSAASGDYTVTVKPYMIVQGGQDFALVVTWGPAPVGGADGGAGTDGGGAPDASAGDGGGGTGGGGGGTGGGSGGGSGGVAGGGHGGDSDDGCGCRAGGSAPAGQAIFALVFFGLALGLVVARRRRRR